MATKDNLIENRFLGTIKIKCNCEKPVWLYHLDKVDVIVVGIDRNEGRFGDVKIIKCPACGNLWLHYHVEYEAFSKSGRWFRALISPEEVNQITPENAVNILEKKEWHIYGGSYFETMGRYGRGNINVGI